MDLPTPQDLRERRNELGLTQSELAERADVSQPLSLVSKAVTWTRGCRHSAGS